MFWYSAIRGSHSSPVGFVSMGSRGMATSTPNVAVRLYLSGGATPIDQTGEAPQPLPHRGCTPCIQGGRPGSQPVRLALKANLAQTSGIRLQRRQRPQTPLLVLVYIRGRRWEGCTSVASLRTASLPPCPDSQHSEPGPCRSFAFGSITVRMSRFTSRATCRLYFTTLKFQSSV